MASKLVKEKTLFFKQHFLMLCFSLQMAVVQSTNHKLVLI